MKAAESLMTTQNVKRATTTDWGFLDGCERAGLEPTKRQWQKWKRRQGRAWASRKK